MRNAPSLLLATLLLAGCGGGGSSSSGGATGATKNQGVAKITVDWPARGRLIPTAANSLVATLSLNGTVVGTQTLVRPADGGPTSATFSGLAYGTYAVGAKAYPNADGSGVAQGVGTGTVVVTEDFPAVASVALGSTVTKLLLSPSGASFAKGATATVTASALDADGNIVLLAANDATEPIVWSLDAATNATLATNGLTATLTGIHSGNVAVSASLATNDAGDVVTSAPLSLAVTPIPDGSTTVTFH